MEEQKPIMIEVKLDDLVEIRQFIKEAQAPKVKFTGTIKEMKEEADAVIRQMLFQIELKLNKWIR